jgi:hypothetical protein
MTEQLDKLSALLLRVQENRRAPRAARGAAAKPPVASAAAMRPAQTRPADDFGDMTPAPPPPPRRPSVDRRATPLEMAVAGELEQQLAAASEARVIAAPAPPIDARREAPAARPARPAAAPALESQALQALQAPQSPQSPQSIEPRIIEPDPPREIVRPIAQVMSKHAPPVDATFGAMLKRSLSLRPH